MLQLAVGELDLDVARRPSRRFIVRAGDVEVHVVGTPLRGDAAARCRQRQCEPWGGVGARGGKNLRLEAGERWSKPTGRRS